MSATGTAGTREATPAEVAKLVRMFRQVCGWTQDTLAALSRLEVRTIQRVERGERSSRDTRRALCAAFGIEDLDAFSRFADDEAVAQARARQEEFERKHVVLDLAPPMGRPSSRC